MGILLALLLGAQTVYWDHDPGIVAPRVEEKNAPEYTAEARMARLEGSVQLTLMVDSDATVRDVHVTRPLGLGLDAKAVEAVREWKFTPGTKDGNPVPVLTRVDVNFRLLTARNDWHLNRASFETAKEPEVRSAAFTEPSDGPASVVVSFEIDPQGNVSQARIETASDPRWEEPVLNAIRQWKFQPPGAKVSARFGFAAGSPPSGAN